MKDSTVASRLEAVLERMEVLLGRMEAAVVTGVAPSPIDPEAQKAADNYIRLRKHQLGLDGDPF